MVLTSQLVQRVQISVRTPKIDFSLIDHRRRNNRAEREVLVPVNVHIFEVIKPKDRDVVLSGPVRIQELKDVFLRSFGLKLPRDRTRLDVDRVQTAIEVAKISDAIRDCR